MWELSRQTASKQRNKKNSSKSWTKHEKKRVLITFEWVREKIYFSFLFFFFFFFFSPLPHATHSLFTHWNDQNIFDDEGKISSRWRKKNLLKARVSKISLGPWRRRSDYAAGERALRDSFGVMNFFFAFTLFIIFDHFRLQVMI